MVLSGIDELSQKSRLLLPKGASTPSGQEEQQVREAGGHGEQLVVGTRIPDRRVQVREAKAVLSAEERPLGLAVGRPLATG